jgi:hypothetical protein
LIEITRRTDMVSSGRIGDLHEAWRGVRPNAKETG